MNSFRFRTALVLALAAPLALAGCSKSSTTIPAMPDCDGVNLLAFTSDRGQVAGETKIYVYDLDTQTFHAVPGTDLSGPEHAPALALDRRTIAFVTSRAATGGDIVLYDRCTDRTIDVPEIVTPYTEHDPAFSGNSQVLGFVRDTTGSQSRLRLYDGQLLKYLPVPAVDTLLGTGTSHAGRPTLTQDAGVIAFAADRGTGWDIWVYDRGADTLRNLPDLRSAGDDVDPWIDPSGRYLVFASNRAGGQGGFDVYLYDLQNKAFVALDGINSPQDDTYPTMSPDANVIVFQSASTRAGAHGGWDLWNYTRSNHALTQGADESSGGADIEPYLAMP